MLPTRLKMSTQHLDDEDKGVIVDLDDVDVDVKLEIDDVNVDELPTQKPHFLDYDAVPPADFEQNFDKVLSFVNTSSTGEQLKLDKKYERDGEVSDYELAASGYTKKEFTQDDNTLHLSNAGSNKSITTSRERKTAYIKPKHFLDENPIPPDYMLADQEQREHHSLDRNFERQNEQQRTASPPTSLSGARKRSLDRVSGVSGSSSRSSRDRFKEPSYTLSRFLDSESHQQLVSSNLCSSPTSSSLQLSQLRKPKSSAWSENFDSRYGSLHLPETANSNEDFVDSDSLGPKVECVYSLLSMLGSNDPLEMAKKFLELSRTAETCDTLRRSGCIPLLVQMMHSADAEDNVRKWASMALHNVVHTHPDEKVGRREAKVLRLLDQIMDYCNFLKTLLQSGGEAIADDSDRHPLAAISSLMKVSFDEEHRHAMCELGALQAIPSLVHLDHAVHGPKPEDQCCNSLRRYALMALTNLTFGDETNKALLCNQKLFMEALVAQLDAAPDDLLQVTASVLRNLSWRANSNMKAILNEIGTVTALARAAMKNKNENTLKAILSALWNLSAHCSTNKAEFCAVDGALAFLVKMLTYEGPSKTLKIIENAGGILRNVSSHIAVREHYRQILREHNCLAILLQQLKSESLTVVSNSCGTLWNLSARCPEDQKFLWDNGAVPMLRSLIHSKHEMISEGSSSALKNLLNFRPSVQNPNSLDPIARSMGLKKLPTLNARKQKALEQELGAKAHSETCENLDAVASGRIAISKVRNTQFDPLKRYPLATAVVPGIVVQPQITASTRLTRSAMLTKSESRDSVFSAKSDSAYENFMRSHSASDANRKTQKMPFVAAAAAFALENDTETADTEQPIDYSVKYNEHATKPVGETTIPTETDDEPVAGANYATYQETDLDQPTDFSLRYAENQLESDADISPADADPLVSTTTTTVSLKAAQQHVKQTDGSGNEILLILEDSVKCYQTEDTPYIISNAASVTDLRQGKSENAVTLDAGGKEASSIATAVTAKKYQRPQVAGNATSYGGAGGTFTPEKPISYCEEGTPGYFSRYDSLSSLDEATQQQQTQTTTTTTTAIGGFEAAVAKSEVTTPDADIKIAANASSSHKEINPSSNTAPIKAAESEATLVAQLPKRVATAPLSNSNSLSAQETPLMFSRHSSMDSLVEEDVGPCDDKSSIVSDFSRLASGVISPSEIPDSPTQSMPQSPRRNSATAETSIAMRSIAVPSTAVDTKQRQQLPSVLEDNTTTFNVENTPAQFSCATSLSNLSIMDEESGTTIDKQTAQANANATKSANIISEDEEEDNCTKHDDLLLAKCINIGMSHRTTGNSANKCKGNAQRTDEPQHYFTEDTPALLSKTGSNTNLSAISMCSSTALNKDQKCNAAPHNANRDSLNLSDDVSSESDAAGQSFDLLQQCIRDGMKRPNTHAKTRAATNTVDPIAMLRRGGDAAVISALPPYLVNNDEMNKFQVEDSPCNFSVMSGLSNLTVGSSLVGPAVQLHGNSSAKTTVKTSEQLVSAAAVAVPTTNTHQEDDVRREPQWQDDSLSSLSIESEDDTHVLSQAIAAGCNRPKSNLGFSHNLSTNNKKTMTSLLSASQPITINAATSASSLLTSATAQQYQRQQQQEQLNSADNANVNGNESYSSVDSSDSNDNQSKSLLELCVLAGMRKTQNRFNNRSLKSHNAVAGTGNANAAADTTQSNPNLKQHFDSLPVQLTSHHTKQTTTRTPNRHLRERERKDEALLMECIELGISKKIAAGSGGAVDRLVNENCNANANANANAMSATFNQLRGSTARDTLFVTNAVPKNALATSAAAERQHQMAYTHRANCIVGAATDVEKNMKTDIISENSYNNSNSSISSNNTNMNSSSSSSKHDECTSVQRNPVPQLKRAHAAEDILQSHAIVQHATTLNDAIGCRSGTELSPTVSLDNTTASDESNESFIMETTVSLDAAQRATISIKQDEKHKDPNLMLKSVERLTLEFVSSAEQLRTNGSSDALNEQQKRHGSISVGGNSNNTWNEDTCPNDVSFPSVSISAPVVASLKFDDDDDDDEDEEVDQATEADHKELHDFAEITPINDAQQEPSSLCLLAACDETDLYYNIGAQPDSLGTETETLMNDIAIGTATTTTPYAVDPSGSGINFRLGGEVQTAAAAVVTAGKPLFFSSASSLMTNSTIIAFEARALADNLQNDYDGSDNTDVTFSLNSLDLDNIRPPSGMDSLNISGYYHEQSLGHSTTQPNSLQRSNIAFPHSPQLSTRSPKFPRKQLPAGLVARRALGQLPHNLGGSAESVNSSCNMLLDNIKPPSLMDELLDSMISVDSIQSEIADCESMATTLSVSHYETAAPGTNDDFDDNTVTLQSCCDLLPLPCDDDKNADMTIAADALSSNSDSTPLQSAEFSSAESTPKKSLGLLSPSPHGVKRALTPKQKRKLAKDRFRTYTIAADIVLSEEQQRQLVAAQQDEMLQIEMYDECVATPTATPPNVHNASANRRRCSQERYKTQTIVCPAQVLATALTPEVGDDTCSLTSTDDCPSEEISSIRAMTRQFKFISNPITTTTAALTTPTDHNSLECDQNSETESCHGHSIETIEDAFETQVKPRIVKLEAVAKTQMAAETEADEASEQTTKAIRGRKKPAYVSPYSMQYQRNSGTVTRLSPNKTYTRTTAIATNALRKRNLNTTAATKLVQKKKITEPSTTTTTPAPLERQGTFVKDEPTIANDDVLPVVDSGSTPTSPSKRAAAASRLPTMRAASASPKKTPVSAVPKKQTTATTSRYNNSTKPPTALAAARKLQTIATPQRSNSNANIRITSNAARISVLTARVSNTTPPSRSNSNLNSNAATVTATAAKINQAQSRIANIWKRVDEVKNKTKAQQQQQHKKTNSASNLKMPQIKATATTTTTYGSKKLNLIRSSTFDNTPTQAATISKTATTTKIAINKHLNNASTTATASATMSSKRTEHINNVTRK